MKVSNYAKSSLWEFILLLLCCSALEYTLFNGFFIPESARGGFVPVVVTAFLLLSLFAIGRNRRSVAIGSVCYAVAVVIILVVSSSMSSTGFFLEDNEGNYFYAAFIVCTVATACFLLSRTLTGSAILMLVGNFLCALIQFFYNQYEILLLVVFFMATLALVVYKNCNISARTADSAKRFAFYSYFLVAAVFVILVIGAGSAVWFGVVAPLNPPAQRIELINEDRSYEEIEVAGTSSSYQTPNLEMSSKSTNSYSRTTDDLLIDEKGEEVQAQVKGGASTSQSEGEQDTSGSQQGMSPDEPEPAFDVFSYLRNPLLWLSLMAILLAACLAYFMGRRAVRSRRLTKLEARGNNEMAEGLYLFILSRYRRLGDAIPQGATVEEYANRNADAFRYFDTESGVEFQELSAIYAARVYGDKDVSDEQADLFARYYRSFWKAARRKLGNVQYFFKSFRI